MIPWLSLIPQLRQTLVNSILRNISTDPVRSYDAPAPLGSGIAVIFDHAFYSRWFSGHEGVPANIKCTGILFSTRSAESIEWRTDLNIREANFFEHQRPAFTRKATGDSRRPEINVPYSRLGNGFTVGDIAELQSSAGA